jgi:Carboxypeptidase regulatory-like domain
MCMKSFFHLPHFRCCYMILLVACLSATACKKSGSGAPDEAKKGYTTGTVTDTKGNPMAGIEVVVENTLLGNHRYGAAVTDDKGQYRIQLSQVGTFHASAYVVKTFNGKEYRMALHPDNDDVFSNEGAVRNFQWKLSGQKPEQMQGFYGARADITNDIGLPIDDPENIEFTLTPVGKLIDGSTGAVLKLKCGAPMTQYYNALVDIPLGRYSVTAIYLHNGQRVPLKLRVTDTNKPYAPAMTLDFEPVTLYGDNMGYIQYNF